MNTAAVQDWIDQVIKPEQIHRYLNKGQSFINDGLIKETLIRKMNPEDSQVREVIAKSLELQRLEPHETAVLLNNENEEIWQEMYAAGLKIKHKVYGRRIVTFAPLYVSNYCVNSCVYCGFRCENQDTQRVRLSTDELAQEILALVSKGHKRLIMVYGEHPSSDVEYIADTLRIAYSTKAGNGEIRRSNVNAAPMSIEDLKKLHEVGIGTFQVFQESYHQDTYRKLHPRGLKANYLWRLYALHRAMEAGVDDVGIGALFGLYDWKYEVMGLLAHSIDLEQKFGGVGPHTISFPRLQPAVNTPFASRSRHLVDDTTFKKLVTVIRLSVPYTGMILTARENALVRNDVINVGCTQIDAGSNIGTGSYSKDSLEPDKQQFMLGDSRSLDEAIRDMARLGYITSFCTAGYRTARTGECFMNLAKDARVNTLCMPNAILTFKEYLEDYASEETRESASFLLEQELAALPGERLQETVRSMLARIEQGERDLFI